MEKMGGGALYAGIFDLERSIWRVIVLVIDTPPFSPQCLGLCFGIFQNA